MTFLSKVNNNILYSLFFVLSLTSALFYTGNNVWLFTSSYLLIIFSLAPVFNQRFNQPIQIHLNGIFIFSFLLLAWFFISIFPSQVKYLSLYNFFWVGSLIIVFLIFTFNENKDRIWKNIWPSILFLITIWATYGLVQYYYLRVPSNATFLNRNSLAALINLALIPAVGYFLIAEKDRPWSFLNNKILSLTLIVLFLTIFIISSRGASLSLLLGFTILITLLRKHVDKIHLRSLILIAVISFSLASLSQFFMSDLPTGFAERMASLQDAPKAGSQRFIIWESLIPLFKDMPWYGFGLGSLWLFWPPFRHTSDTSAGYFAHNDYMQIMLEAGYPGIIILVVLLFFILKTFIRTLKSNSHNLTLLQRVEIISLFAALTTFSSHSIFTYNFYILPLLIIAGVYLARFNQLCNLNSNHHKTFPALNIYFKPSIFIFCTAGIILILSSYFLTISFSSYYVKQAKALMLKNQFQASSQLFFRAQTLAPLMDNAFFSHADLLRRGANKLLRVNKQNQANSLLEYAQANLDKAEKLNPLRAQTHHIRGLIYDVEQPDKAIIEYEKALKLDPRFLFSRIRLAKIHHKQNHLKQAMEVLYNGVNYNYRVDKVMLEYMTIFAEYSREAGVESFALHLEANIKKFIEQNSKK